jgi:hypothetical protein
MKTLILVLAIIMISSAAFGTPTIGIYFTDVPGEMTYFLNDPPGVQEFDAYIYAHFVGCMLSAVEFKIDMPSSINYTGTSFPPEATVSLGDPINGISIAYAPALDGIGSAQNFLCTIHLWSLDRCTCNLGTLEDSPMTVVAHPGSGHLRGTCHPENYLFELQGMMSILCPKAVGTETKSWGAIKSLFK